MPVSIIQFFFCYPCEVQIVDSSHSHPIIIFTLRLRTYKRLNNSLFLSRCDSYKMTAQAFAVCFGFCPSHALVKDLVIIRIRIVPPFNFACVWECKLCFVAADDSCLNIVLKYQLSVFKVNDSVCVYVCRCFVDWCRFIAVENIIFDQRCVFCGYLPVAVCISVQHVSFRLSVFRRYNISRKVHRQHTARQRHRSDCRKQLADFCVTHA